MLLSTVSSLELSGPPAHAARLGSDARVPCMITVDNPPVDPNRLTIFWHFQEKEILSYNKTVRTTTSRYSLNTKELRDGIASLAISNIQIPNGGMYKCSVIYGSERKEKEVRLDIGAPPQVTVTDKMAVVNAESVLRCSVTGFYPVDIDVKWFKDTERLSNVTVDPPQRNPDRTYSMNSTVTITPTEEDRARIFSCRVRHDFLQNDLHKDFRLVYEDRSSAWIIAACSVSVAILIIIIAAVLWWKLKLKNKVPFIVRDIAGPGRLIDGEEAVLCCTVDNAPEDLSVTWLIRRAGQEQEIQTSQMRGHSEEEEESLLDRSYVIKSQREGRQYSSSLSFIPHMERHKDVTFICRGISGHHKAERMYHCKTTYGKPKIKIQDKRNLLPGQIKYLLSLEKFYPKSIKIVWTCGAKETQEVVSSTESISENPDRSYNVSSEVVIPEDRHKDPEFRVRVTRKHESMEKPGSRELSIRDSDYRWTPVAGDIQVPRLLLGSPAALQCNISGYFPDAVTVRWMRRDGDELLTDDNQRITSWRAADNTYSRTASLTITPDLRTHQGAEYICLVEHPSLERPIERRTGRLLVYGKPQMSAPIAITMADKSRVQFSLNLQKFYPKDIKISWTREDKFRTYPLSAEKPIISQDDDLSYNITSVVKIYNDVFKIPEMKIIVDWKHKSTETSETRSLSVRDFPWRPHVGSISVPELKDGREATMTCDISGYFPDLLSVTWFTNKDGNVIALPREPSKRFTLFRESSYAERIYKMSEEKKRQKDNTYSCEASVTFTPISSDEGSEILCRVEHPREERPIERSTGPLHIAPRSSQFPSVAFT